MATEIDQNLKFPKLRSDLKISQMKHHQKISFVIKDPLKGEYYKFDQIEWDIISLFDGKKTPEEMLEIYNQKHPFAKIELETITSFLKGVGDMNLLQKDKIQTNVMLVEKMKEMRKSQILSKKGSIMYRRFPLVDPDHFFNKIVPYLRWIWTPTFLIISLSLMLGSVAIIFSHWYEFTEGMREIFTFSNMSVWNFLVLWVAVYLTIGIHELGHGLTCKHYGGDVHEIGFLLLFFQPCLYCNVNDAWMFDKKWKQIVVTLAGGYIEFFIGSLCAYVWYLTNPNTFLHLICFQVMIICSVSTILFNFNPLVKLDGYYLLSDFLSIPNLKEESANYIKFLSKKYIFRQSEEIYECLESEKKYLLIYGILSGFWTMGMLFGLYKMAQGLLVDKFHEVGVLISLFIAWKIFGGHIKKSIQFLGPWILKRKAMLTTKKAKAIYGLIGVCIILVLIIPVPYKVYGDCELTPSFIQPIRALSSGEIVKFYKHSGEVVHKGEMLVELKNPKLELEREIANLQFQKMTTKIRNQMNPSGLKEYESEKIAFEIADKKLRNLKLGFISDQNEIGVLTCPDEIKMLNRFVKEGDEVCKVLGEDKLHTVVEISEQEVRMIKEEQAVRFKLFSSPMKTYEGIVHKIKPTSTFDPKNPKHKMFKVELAINNPGHLKPGMKGKAKIIGKTMPVFGHIGTKLAMALRLDLFF